MFTFLCCDYFMDNPNAIADAQNLVNALNERKKYWESVKNVNAARKAQAEEERKKKEAENSLPPLPENVTIGEDGSLQAVDNNEEKAQEQPTEQPQGQKYTLSKQTADNGEFFYQNENGIIDLANMSQDLFDEIGYTKAPLRLTPSMITHMIKRHGKETKADDVDKAVDFILDVMNNFDHVRLGRNGALVFSIENGRERTGKRAISILLGSSNGDYYGIVSSGYEGVERLNRRPLLWAGSAVIAPATDAATVSVTSRDAQKSSEQSGGASDLSNVPSVSEDTTSEEEMQESARENADKAQEIDAASTAQQAEEQDREERKQMLENMSIEELEKEIERIRNFNHPIFTMTEEEKANEIAELQSIIDRKTQTSAQQPTAEEATPQAEEQQTANETANEERKESEEDADNV